MTSVCLELGFENYFFPFQETNNIQIQYVNLVCAGPLSLIWIFFSYGCVVVTQVVAVILAFRTRKVTIKALNDSKYLTIIIYVSSVIIALMLISAVLLQDYLNIDAAVFGGLIILFTTVVLGLTFIPKVLSETSTLPVSISLFYIS